MQSLLLPFTPRFIALTLSALATARSAKKRVVDAAEKDKRAAAKQEDELLAESDRITRLIKDAETAAKRQSTTTTRPTTGSPVTPSGKTRIALLLPLSGRNASIGQAMQQAAEMSLFESGAKELSLAAYDSGDTPAQATDAYRRAKLDGVALVVQPRLPYVSLARAVCRSAAVPLPMVDALPLAGEPYAAAVDQVLACVGANMARAQAVELLRSPHLSFVDEDGARLSDADNCFNLNSLAAETAPGKLSQRSGATAQFTELMVLLASIDITDDTLGLRPNRKRREKVARRMLGSLRAAG